jgi:hypothetical protein
LSLTTNQGKPTNGTIVASCSSSRVSKHGFAACAASSLNIFENRATHAIYRRRAPRRRRNFVAEEAHLLLEPSNKPHASDGPDALARFFPFFWAFSWPFCSFSSFLRIAILVG